MLVVNVAGTGVGGLVSLLDLTLRVGRRAGRVVGVVGKLLEVQGTSEMERDLLVQGRERARKGVGRRRARARGRVHVGDSVVRAREANVFVNDLRDLVAVVVAGNEGAVVSKRLGGEHGGGGQERGLGDGEYHE